MLENVESLISGEGSIEIGRIGPVRCAAVASDENQMLAALVRRKGESLMDLMHRLDKAIEKAWGKEIYTDEINSPSRR